MCMFLNPLVSFLGSVTEIPIHMHESNKHMYPLYMQIDVR